MRKTAIAAMLAAGLGLGTIAGVNAALPKPPAIIIVHHFKKADGSEGQRGRSLMEKLAGSYKLGSAARCVLGMVHASDETEEDRIVWACAKNNDGELGAIVDFALTQRCVRGARRRRGDLPLPPAPPSVDQALPVGADLRGPGARARDR